MTEEGGTIFISKDVRGQLKRIRTDPSETYDDTIRKLLKLIEFKPASLLLREEGEK